MLAEGGIRDPRLGDNRMHIRRLALAVAGSAVLVAASVTAAAAATPEKSKVVSRYWRTWLGIEWIDKPTSADPTTIFTGVSLYSWERVTITAGGGSVGSGVVREAGTTVKVRTFHLVYGVRDGQAGWHYEDISVWTAANANAPTMDSRLARGSAAADVPGIGEVRGMCTGFGPYHPNSGPYETSNQRSCTATIYFNGVAQLGSRNEIGDLFVAQGQKIGG
jgi:hypothetical protein